MTFHTEARVCRRCKTLRKAEELNIEGMIHHRCPIECKDRKSCERRKRKSKNETNQTAKTSSRD